MKEIDRAASIFLRAVLRRMKDLGLNQTSLAVRMNASRPYVTKVLNGDVSITLRTASRFAKALQMDFLPLLTPQEKALSTITHTLDADPSTSSQHPVQSENSLFGLEV